MMRKCLLFGLASLFLFVGTLHSQTRMNVPNGSFEHWTTQSGYNISVLGMSLPVYESYSIPNGWNHLSYPVNESFSFYGTSISINTSLPLIKVSQETGVVPDSSYAVKLQSFMLNDIVTGLVYALAAPQLDTMLTQTVFPSILSTGAVNLDTLIPIVTNLFSNFDSVESILMSLASINVNNMVSGGIALGGFLPTRMTGSYKYHAAGSGDNGGVLLLGTRYNSTTHRRDVVGGGANIALNDVTNYSPFTVDYMSLHDLDASFPDQTPDSLVILLLSSASTTMQQGSWLCVDNLALWNDTTVVVDSSTCADIVALAATPDIHEAVLNWSTTDVVSGFDLEYGPAGFALGSGTAMTLTNNTVSFSGLDANTLYDVYLRTRCNDSIYGDWTSIQFSTLPDTCASVRWMELVNVVYDHFPQIELQWQGGSQPDHWEVEYGLQGFELGSGTMVETNETSFAIYELEEQGVLQPNTWYDFYVRSACEDGVYGEWDSVHYRTFCATVEDLTLVDDNISVNADNLIEGYMVTWVDNSGTAQWAVSYGTSNAYNWHTEIVNEPAVQLEPLSPNTLYSVEVSARCGEEDFSDVRYINFTTITVGIAEADALSLSVSPNPADGRCTVTLSDNAPALLKLYSTDGRLIQTINYSGSPVELLLPAQGVYLLHATSANGTSMLKIVNK